MNAIRQALARLLGWRAVRAPLAFLRRWGRVALDKVPTTPLGALLALSGWLAVRELGRKRQDIVLYVAGLGALAAMLVALVMVVAATLVLWRRTRGLASRSPARLDAGRLVETGFAMPSWAALPLVSFAWEWLEPETVEVEPRRRDGRLVEEVVFGERGEHARTLRRVVVEDALGLCRLAFRVEEETPRTIYPALGRPLSVPLLEAFAGGDHVSHPAGPPDGDLVEMRRYVMGDPMKRILWKTWARSRTLMVRMPERAISPTQKTLAYLVAGEGDEAAASVARLAVESDALGPEWRFSADLPDGAEEDATDSHRALALIVRSRAARERGGRGLGGFLERSIGYGARRCVVFAPGRVGPWLARVEEQARLRPGNVEVVLGTDGVRGAGVRGRWRRFFFRDEEEADPSRARARQEELDHITKRLASCGATVTAIDRPTGKVFGRAGRRRRA
jgi:hypothetical protein